MVSDEWVVTASGYRMMLLYWLSSPSPMPPGLFAFNDVNCDLKFDPKVDKREVILGGLNAIKDD